MTIKDKDRRVLMWASFIYVLVVGTVLLGAALKGIDVSKAEVVFGTITGFLMTGVVANYFSKPGKD